MHLDVMVVVAAAAAVDDDDVMTLTYGNEVLETMALLMRCHRRRYHYEMSEFVHSLSRCTFSVDTSVDTTLSHQLTVLMSLDQ